MKKKIRLLGRKKAEKALKNDIEKDIRKDVKKDISKLVTKRVDKKLGKSIGSLKNEAFDEIDSFERTLIDEFNQRYRKSVGRIIFISITAVVLVITVIVITAISMANQSKNQLTRLHHEQLEQLDKYVQQLEEKLDSITSTYTKNMEIQIKEEIRSDEFRQFASDNIKQQTQSMAPAIIERKTARAIVNAEEEFKAYLDSLKNAATPEINQ